MYGMFNGASAFNQPRVRPAIIVARMFNIFVVDTRGCLSLKGLKITGRM